MASGLSKSEWLSLWGILWRMLLFGLILMPLGLLFLCAALTAMLAPLVLALYLAFSEHLVWAAVVLGLWFFGLNRARPVLRWLFEGLEYAGI